MARERERGGEREGNREREKSHVVELSLYRHKDEVDESKDRGDEGKKRGGGVNIRVCVCV